jgi:hypothetical protein
MHSKQTGSMNVATKDLQRWHGQRILLIRRIPNIFAASTPARLDFCTVVKRVQTIDASCYSVFEHSDIVAQKLIAVMQSDALSLDFMADELIDSDRAVFFKEKQ